ncbi:unnamed protein product [Vitrella brassicaformis CCMP3155]|uniref:Uncharacterized protein n=1 Tax=Vitrella brassicaformis (strain CCMP3155) TaxID=1169540 RepID=A0A0G4FI36_VITBC|nr:unnamed protein product [Vitrella brassicaformis CCMP3155]|eukprot:CEM13159.1 unnamed protein product [Vitrella brassicaformis CCMP3155]
MQNEQRDSMREFCARRCQRYQTTARVLLRGGAAPSLSLISSLTEPSRQLVLAEYAAVLNELPSVVMAAINGALRPQRWLASVITPLLPIAPHHDGDYPCPSPSNLSFGPQEAEAISWKIAAFVYEPSAAMAAIDEHLIGDSRLRRRMRVAVGHFVSQASTRARGNREVVGALADVGALTVRVPLQCFAVNGGSGQHRLLGVREVVHRARLDEAAQHGVEGVEKGFNEHLGNDDCEFSGWEQLGYLDNERHQFVPLGID